LRKSTCRGCGATSLRLIYDFGPQPLAGEFPQLPESSRQAERFPLDLSQCDVCGLLQITHLPPIGAVFHDDYRYASSTIPGLVAHFADYAAWLESRLSTGSHVLEFGCNDGVLLGKLSARGYKCIGVDASDNVASMARSKGLSIHTGFMSLDLVHEKALKSQFDLITCSNVFAHIEDLNGTISAARIALKPGGLFIVEVHDGDRVFLENQFETIYHEHQSYFTERTLRRTLERGGFEFVECVRTPMHGGALRLVSRRNDATSLIPLAFSPDERFDSAQFSAAIARCTDDIRAAAEQYGPMDGYGAAGRAQMFINITGTADCFSQVFDDSQLRQGRFIVGTDIPIRRFTAGRGRACIILAWNYAADISSRVRDNYETVFTVLPQRKEW
jgi:SAM-dependent methyltransferase